MSKPTHRHIYFKANINKNLEVLQRQIVAAKNYIAKKKGFSNFESFTFGFIDDDILNEKMRIKLTFKL